MQDIHDTLMFIFDRESSRGSSRVLHHSMKAGHNSRRYISERRSSCVCKDNILPALML